MIAGMKDDADAWQAYPTDRWVYDRLLLAQRLGYECGPADVPFPRVGKWFAKPTINLRGMANGAAVVESRDEVPDGHFWMPYFVGPHISVNYTRKDASGSWVAGEKLLGVKDRHGRFTAWVRVRRCPKLPALFNKLTETLLLNVEYIGGNVIEAHLRHGKDFRHEPDATVAIPVWEDDVQVLDYWPDAAGERLGFYYLR